MEENLDTILFLEMDTDAAQELMSDISDFDNTLDFMLFPEQ